MTPFERLQHLIPMTERLIAEEKTLEMGEFVEDDSDPYNCGTAACLAGWAARDETLRAEGLKLVHLVWEVTPGYNDLTGWDALGEFFGLHSNQTTFLFSGKYSSSLQSALSRVRRVVADQQLATSPE